MELLRTRIDWFRCRIGEISFIHVDREYREITPPAQYGAEDNVRLLLTINPACSFSCPLPRTR